MELERVILGTGSYFNVRSGNTVSIARDGGRAWGYTGPYFNKIAPRLDTSVPYSRKYHQLLELRESASNYKEYLDFKEKIENDYIESYYESKLRYLDVEEFLFTLYKLYGNDIILLCKEHPIDFCHRRLLADYIELKTGIYIPEVGVDFGGDVYKVEPIRYKKRLQKNMR